MSAALQLPTVWGTNSWTEAWPAGRPQEEPQPLREPRIVTPEVEQAAEQKPEVCLAFYRKHTERLLRRYLYASMQLGRAPSILSDPVGRGWASSRTVRTFEDAVIFVLDVERCLDRLGALERTLLAKIVLQAYTQAETAVLLGMSPRNVGYRFARALDQLTEQLLKAELLEIPRM